MIGDPIWIPCVACKREMERVRTVDKDDQSRPLHIEMYRCPDESCARKAVLMYEPLGGLAEDQRSFVEREIARSGAFFPSDFTGSGGRRHEPRE